jgi:hypothetical protein
VPTAPRPPDPVPPPTRYASRGGVSRRALVGVAVVCLLAGGGVAAVVAGVGSGGAEEGGISAAPAVADGGAEAPPAEQPTTGGEAAEADVPSAPPAAPITPAPTEEQVSLARLETMRSAALQTVTLDGRWVAQVASKSIGITDPLQVARNGTHIFYAADILAESESAAAAAGTSRVLLMHSTDFGKRSTAPDGQPYWVTIVDAGFGSADGVNAWCAQTYAALSPAELANACAPRTLSPPHD